jgi:hypothetical protein
MPAGTRRLTCRFTRPIRARRCAIPGDPPIDPSELANARERAQAFVERHGEEFAKRRARALVDRARALAVSEWLAALQLPDGGFPGASGSDPVSTRRALAALVQLGVRKGAIVERAVANLVRAQRPEGCWHPQGDDTEEGAVEATGRIAGVLARTGSVRARTLDAAADWLAARFAPERVQGFALAALGAYAATFANVPHDESDAILQWCGRELERGFRAGAFDAARTARVLVDCDAPSLPGARLAAGDVVAALLREQAPDGGWPPQGAEMRCRVAKALDALAGLARLARC